MTNNVLALNPSGASAAPIAPAPANHALLYARAYASRGLPVFPLVGKQPDGLLTPNGLHNASTDPAQIEAWWGSYERSHALNIGLALPHDLIAVDIDPRNGGSETLATIMNDPARGFPPTRTQATGGGGWHMLFRLPGGANAGALASMLPGKIGPGIDLKKSGGYIVVAPSIHPDTGRSYQWIGDFDAPIANAPSWLLALSAPTFHRRESHPDIEAEAELEPTAVNRAAALLAPHYVEGVRHHFCRALGGWLRTRGYGEECARELGQAIADKRGVLSGVSTISKGWNTSPHSRPGWTLLCEQIGGATSPAARELEELIPDAAFAARRAAERAALAAISAPILAAVPPPPPPPAAPPGPQLPPDFQLDQSAPIMVDDLERLAKAWTKSKHSHEADNGRSQGHAVQR